MADLIAIISSIGGNLLHVTCPGTLVFCPHVQEKVYLSFLGIYKYISCQQFPGLMGCISWRNGEGRRLCL